LLSSSTRNIALGSGSTTVAITSMASSFGNQRSSQSTIFRISRDTSAIGRRPSTL
jgi:hypothetical protein